MTTQPRILLVAELANPDWISVPLVGWNHVNGIMEFADIHLATHARNRDNLLKAGFPEERLSCFAGASDDWIHRLTGLLAASGAMGGFTETALSVPRYFEFEQRVWQAFAARLRAGEFVLVHRVTPTSPGVPSTLAKRLAGIGVPFVLGPINGGVPWPRGFKEARRREGEWLSYLRPLARFLPYHYATRKYASAVIVGSASAWREVPTEFVGKTFYLPENAVIKDNFTTQTRAYAVRPLRVAFAGRLVACKGTDLLLAAAAPLVRAGRMVVDIIGDGPEMKRLKTIVVQEDLGSGVRLDGWVPYKDLQSRLAESCVLGFPSVREFGGAAVMEAMALGLIPVVAEYGGPGEVVTDETGFRLPLTDPESVVTRLRQVFEQLLGMPPTQLEEMGCRARRRILDEFSLEAKARKTERIYRWVLGDSASRPDLVPPAGSLSWYS